MANPVLRALLGPGADRVSQRVRDRRARRAVRRAGRGSGQPWPGQAAPRAVEQLRPPPQWPASAEAPSPLWSADQQPPFAAAAASAHTAVADRPSDAEDAAAPWVPVEGEPSASWWMRARQVTVIAGVVVVMVAGTVSTVSTIAHWVAPARPSAVAPAISDVELAGFGQVVATDYLSWDQDDKPSRQTALARVAAPGVSIDGWNGQGRQWADSAATIAVARGPGDRAVVTVRARVVPFTPAPASGAPSPLPPQQHTDPGGTVAAAPQVVTSGWIAQPVRWATLAIPVRTSGTAPVVSAPPVLIGSAPEMVDRPAVPGTDLGDDVLAASTKDTVAKLLSSYASGDLSYARASGTRFRGLDGAAVLAKVQRWRVAEPLPGSDPDRRRGDVSVTWQLSGNAQLTSSYLIELSRVDDRWYLAAVAPETEEISS